MDLGSLLPVIHKLVSENDLQLGCGIEPACCGRWASPDPWGGRRSPVLKLQRNFCSSAGILITQGYLHLKLNLSFSI